MEEVLGPPSWKEYIMRKLFTIFLLFISSIGGCSKTTIHDYDYEDFSDIQLSWENLFFPAKERYFVYIYSFYCSHCNHVKQDVLSMINDNLEAFYLMEYSQEIPIGLDVDITIGKSDLEDIFILGTPTIIGVYDYAVVLNIGGESAILEFINNYPTYI